MNDARRLVPSTDSVMADPRLVAAELRLGRPLVKGVVVLRVDKVTVAARGTGSACT